MEGTGHRPPHAVLDAYGCAGATITAETIKAKKAVWYVDLPGAAWVLKRSPLTEGRLQFVLAAADHLRSRGLRIPEIVPARDGSPYVATPEGLFFMTPRVRGSAPSYEKPDQLARILQELARFHRESAGFSPWGFPEAHIQLGVWPHQYQKRLSRLESAGGSGPFWEAAQPYHGAMVEAARLALERLRRSAYPDWVEETRRRGGLCHQDFAAGNLILEGSGELAILDLDAISVEIPARDLRKILIKVQKKRRAWDDGLARSMLAAYHQENRLTPAQYQVLQADLLFPHLYHGLVSKVLNGREPDWAPDKFLSRLQEVVAFEQSKWEALSGSRAHCPHGLPDGPSHPNGGDR